MSTANGNELKQLLIDLLGQKNRLSIHKSLVYFTGSLERALVLDQIIFWSERSTDAKDGWFHKSYEEWEEEITIPKHTLNRIFIYFESLNLMQRKTKVVRGVRKLFIKADMSAIIDQLVDHSSKSCKVQLCTKNNTGDSSENVQKLQSVSLQSHNLQLSYIEQNPLSQLKDNDVTHTQNSGCSDGSNGDIVSPPQQTGVTLYQETYFPMPVEAVTEITLDWLVKNNPHRLPAQMLSDWLIIRKKKKSAVTFTAWDQLNKELSKLEALNKNPVDMFELAVANGWATLKADWFADNSPGRNSKAKEYDHQSTNWGNKAREHFNKRKGMNT